MGTLDDMLEKFKAEHGPTIDEQYNKIEGAEACSMEYTIDPAGKIIWFDPADGLLHVKEVVKVEA